MECLTVGELITQLSIFDPNTPVVACCDYGDRNNTMQAIPVTELADVFIEETAYSDSGFKVVDEGSEPVVVLNYDSML